MSEIKNCPFCGREAEFPEVSEVYGTYYEYECDCGLSHVSVQICDHMSLDERANETFGDKYDNKYIERARKIAIGLWNIRRKNENM